MKTAMGFLAAAVIGAALPAAPAAATAVAGAAAILTNRVCNNPAGQLCTSVPRIFTQYAGGMGGGFTTSASNMNGLGASAGAYASFGAGYLPTIGVSSASGSGTRSGGNAEAFRSFTNMGDRAIDLALNGRLHFVTSGDTMPGEAAGEGNLNVLLSLIPRSMLDQFNANSSGQEIVDANIAFADCGGGALASTGYTTAPGMTPAGEYVFDLSLSQTCGGASITINPGEEFVVLVTMQALSNRGGFLNAMNTFAVQYDLENTLFADTGEAVGAAYLAETIDSDVPEPASLATLLVGCGLTAVARRRRR